MIIRKGNTGDLTDMKLLFAETITYVCKDDYTNEQLEVWKSGVENEERWQKVMEEQLILVALHGDKTVGFCTLNQGNYIDLLFVHKDYQHRGIAQALYTQIEQEAIQQEESKLSADVSKTAKPFFEKMGFKVNAEQTVTVKGIDLINYKMSKSLIK
ncbi:GNAT family N-acetyltransferase [Chryseobacterium sp. WG14]|uniref:GNAT family N-acetyltransferase n=1 Tax=unclassified Chryseobacterium TaxID=2593645 RepID=UPI001DF6A609|nr:MULTISPECIES: GNAT family N-acetyltransferase [unclassified Chryseobacterium]MCQ9635924.1 GNAT family N-acetyltransferase [Chryseobacterium sp. WG23]MCQ9640740.1 GNAT family N-acetyltransferase [Chryseobacterium sp. WG14]CAH0277024.1 putative N-acetyltransferase YafP [Chryseobacterium sp. Bi04]